MSRTQDLTIVVEDESPGIDVPQEVRECPGMNPYAFDVWKALYRNPGDTKLYAIANEAGQSTTSTRKAFSTLQRLGLVVAFSPQHGPPRTVIAVLTKPNDRAAQRFRAAQGSVGEVGTR